MAYTRDTSRRLYAERALSSYEAMQRHLYAGDGTSRYYERPRGLGRRGYAHLWPFTRALAATLDLCALDPSLLGGLDRESALADRVAGLERYWNARSDPPAYDSDVVAPLGGGGDQYYDDNAWVGLALVQDHRLSGRASSRERAEELFAFALTGWDRAPDEAHPGGIFWLRQGVGRGRRNHSRNTVSTAPNAELGLRLQELTGGVRFDGREGRVGAREMYEWVNGTFDESRGGEEPGTGLFADRIEPRAGIQRELWTYNQGTMIAVNVLLHRLGGAGGSIYLGRAEGIARRALARYRGAYEGQPEQFNAIFFRNLLLLCSASDDEGLRDEILRTMSAYAEESWQRRRGRDGLLPARGAPLVKHAAMVQIFALLAWEPGRYGEL